MHIKDSDIKEALDSLDKAAKQLPRLFGNSLVRKDLEDNIGQAIAALSGESEEKAEDSEESDWPQSISEIADRTLGYFELNNLQRPSAADHALLTEILEQFYSHLKGLT